MSCDFGAAAGDTETIRRLMFLAFEQAFQTQIASLYKVYTTNAPSVTDQRAATRRGIDNAIAAYRLAIEAVEGWDGR